MNAWKLIAHAEGTMFFVRAQPGARRNQLTGIYNGAARVAVTAAPEKGKANDAIVEVLCDALELSASRIVLIAGETQRDKKFLAVGVDEATLSSRLDRAIAS